MSTSLPKEAKKYYARPDKILDLLTSAVQLPLRLGSGAFVEGYSAKVVREQPENDEEYSAFKFGGFKVLEKGRFWDRAQPKSPIELYEHEGCPFCRKVREAVNILDLDVLYYPCPQNGPNFRPKANELGGQKQFPYMVDKNTGAAMYESDAIVSYLFDTYGDGASPPFALRAGFLTTLTAGLGMLARPLKGSKYQPATMPKKPLELWGYEASPFTKIVREKLSAMEIPHKFISAARGSSKRQRLFELGGAGQTPYLVDPNTNVQGYESAEIIDYLERTYATNA